MRSAESSQQARQAIDAIFRAESRQVLSTLIRLVGDFDLAEDAMQEAFAAALKQWPTEGIPANPRAWLISSGRFKAIDAMRRRAKHDASLQEIAEKIETVPEYGAVEDDVLRLIFTCCHPALSNEAQVALTLREVCGLTTEEIARAFLTSPTTLAQRIVRAKARIREAEIPYEVPDKSDLPERLGNVLRVAYLVFNEGYYASSGASLTRQSVSGEAIRLGRLLAELLPEPEVLGLLALMLLHESRREARSDPSGDLILLEDQDRSRWNQEMVGEAKRLVAKALGRNAPGTYTLQAAIAAVHADAATFADTDWSRIVDIYDALSQTISSPVVQLNRAVAVAMRDGPAVGLALVDEILERGVLDDYGPAHSTRADLCRRLGLAEEARESYQRALKLANQGPERRFIQRRLNELSE